MDNWTGLLGEMPHIAPDISFRIVEEVLVDGSEETKTEVLGAHKFVLAMVSDVFKALFYGTMRDETEEILIRDTTIEAFKEFLKMIYILAETKRCDTQVTDMYLLLEILNLAKRYIIPKSVAFIEERLSSVTEETVMDVAAEAMKFENMFQEEAQKILISCAKYLQPKLKDTRSIFRYAKEMKDHKETFTALLAVINDLPPIVCLNCKYEVCQHGRSVKEGDIRVGLTVTKNRASGAWELADPRADWWAANHDSGNLKVTMVEDKKASYESINFACRGTVNSIIFKGLPVFLFSCN